MGSSWQVYWSGLPSPPPVDHVLSELSTVTHLPWVALHSLAHSVIEFSRPLRHNKAVIREGARYLDEVFISFELVLSLLLAFVQCGSFSVSLCWSNGVHAECPGQFMVVLCGSSSLVSDGTLLSVSGGLFIRGHQRNPLA